MSVFRGRLAELQSEPEGRNWVFVPYDQLTDDVGPLADEPPEELGIVLVESTWKANRRPYHRQKLALVLANLRHFALEQAARGVAVRHVVAEGSYGQVLERVGGELGPLRVREPAERELCVDLAPLVERGVLEVVPHGGWLTTEAWFAESQPDGPPWRMDAFYRHVRRETGVLMDAGSPVGGKYSMDVENRRPWTGDPPTPEPPSFMPDEVTDEVLELVDARFADHPGRLRPDFLPATAEDAGSLWDWAKRECLEHFGPYEDAMSRRSSGLFHTRISPLLNLGRLDARRVLSEVLTLDVPLASKEGFVRQLLGWREFVRHVHRATDGFRTLPGDDPAVRVHPGDAGWASGTRGAEPGEGAAQAIVEREPAAHGGPPDGSGTSPLDGGADPSVLGAGGGLPPAYWGAPSGLACLDRVVSDVLAEGWSHHITRLMVLSNVASLLDVRPRELTDWFWAAYADAYDWVVEPNVLAMGTFGVGDLMTTKPYVAGSNYIDRMSDYCGACRFDPRTDCPLRRLYWAYLARHEESLTGNRRMALPLASLRKRDAEERELDDRTFHWAREVLQRGGTLEPADAPTAGGEGDG